MRPDVASRPPSTSQPTFGRFPAPHPERRRRTSELFDQAAAQSIDQLKVELWDAIVVLNLPVARSIAGHYRGRGCELEDLEQAACLALVRAVQRFDVTRGEDFLSYAVPSIRGEIKRYFRDFGWMVRPPRSVQELRPRVMAEAALEAASTGRRPDPELIAERLGTSAAAVRAAMQAEGCFSVVSLDRSARGTGDGTGTMAGTLAGTLECPSEDGFAAAEARAMVAAGLDELSQRDRVAIHLRFVDDLSQSEIGSILGISQTQVSRLLHDALKQMRDYMSEPATSYAQSA